jgi:hypothetical protein
MTRRAAVGIIGAAPAGNRLQGESETVFFQL